MTRAEPKLLADRIDGCLFGAAIGDALGSAFEFVTADDIERHVGSGIVTTYHAAMPGSLLHPRKPGYPTDDTAMALSVAGAIASGEPLTAALFAERFLRDLDRRDGRYGAMFWGGGPGGACTRALARLRAGAAPERGGHPEDGGNGAAMRAHPVGFLADRDRVIEVGAVQARVTHGHPGAVAAAQAVAVLVYDALHDAPLSPDVPAGIDEPTFTASWRDLHAYVESGATRLPPRLRNVAMSGWESVSAAHAIALCFLGDPLRAVGAAAGSGGDTDTLATIVGAIVGARHGMAMFPEELVTGLRARTAVQEIAELCAARALHDSAA
jgi:ADP-ribosylglycohydrolase